MNILKIIVYIITFAPNFVLAQYIPSYTHITNNDTYYITYTNTDDVKAPVIEDKRVQFLPYIFKNKKANDLIHKMYEKKNVPEFYYKIESTLGKEIATKFLLVMATESNGNLRATNRNRNGTYDCGLLQINQKGRCTEKSFSIDWQVSQTISKYRYNKFKPWYGAWYHKNLLRLIGVRQVWNVV